MMPVLRALLRWSLLLFFFLTSLYGLFTYVRFTFTQVIEAGLLPWLSSFARVHHWLFGGAVALAIATLAGDLRSPSTRGPAMFYALLSVGAAAALAVHPVLPKLGNDERSLIFALVALLPLFGLAVVDHLATRGRVRWGWTSTRDDGAIFAACAVCLGLAFVTYSLAFHIRAATDLGVQGREEAVGLLLSFLLHASFVGASFVVWCLARSLAAWVGGARASWEYGAMALLAFALFALLLRNVAFSAMSFEGPVATAVAAAWSLVLVLAVSGMALREQSTSNERVESGLRLFMSPLSMRASRLVLKVAWLVAMVALAVRFQVVASRMDWNGLMQKLCACLSWIMIFAALLAVFRRPRGGEGRTILFILLSCSGTLAYGSWRSFGRPADSTPVLDKIATAEPSFGFLYQLTGFASKRQTMGELFEFMQRNTNLSRERRIEPREVTFATGLGSPSSAPRPHIFIIVIDSLRRDYVSPFNPAVTFTPSLEKFARSSDVFVNAFTHYGATGLSEPSIWVGGMMPHKQYVTPFAPMNALEKLLRGEHYLRLVSVDSILGQLLEQDASLVPLDANKVTGDYDLCASLDELREKMDDRRDGAAPFFAYTQPQNIHVSRIQREAASVPPGEHFPGFYDPYASRLKRIDACFGRFIDYLEARGLYENSVVVFTADHGDLLGEEGRWGHAYNLNPEVVRIPLIIHRPTRLRELPSDTSAIAFSTDIAPTLYRLLGYEPAALGAGFGQSLYGPRPAAREWSLLVSSYGPVYGILEDGAKHLYVADAVNYTDSYFDVAAGSAAPRDPVSEDVRARNAQRIVSAVKELHEAYHVR
jgi:arylsulfatase A-like enzyme